MINIFHDWVCSHTKVHFSKKMDNYTPVVVFNIDGSYQFFPFKKKDNGIFKDVDFGDNRFCGSQGPRVIDDTDNILVIYSNTCSQEDLDNKQNYKLNPIGMEFVGYVSCGCGHEEYNLIYGKVGFVKYNDGKPVDLTESDIEWIKNYKRPHHHHQKKCILL